MRILSIDLGMRRTGLAFADVSVGVPLALDTIEHTTLDECIQKIADVVESHKIDKMIVGLPLLPSGERGFQAEYVEDVVDALESLEIPIELLDERYSTSAEPDVDPDAAAAVKMLETALNRNEK